VTQNRWQIGALYYGGLQNGQPFWTQPGGIGTIVYPQPQNGPWTDYPIGGLTINETGFAWWLPGCGHSIQAWRLIQEFDYDTNQSVMLITCPSCSWVQNVLSPASEAYDPISHCIIVA
jgi:hypothetical protein